MCLTRAGLRECILFSSLYLFETGNKYSSSLFETSYKRCISHSSSYCNQKLGKDPVKTLLENPNVNRNKHLIN